MTIEQSLEAMGFAQIGTSGNNRMYGNATDNVMSGGAGGHDTLLGRRGEDVLHGGFRRPVENPNDNVDRDVLFGGVDADVFMAITAINEQGWDGFGTTMLGSHNDLVEDFNSGEDKLDVAFWHQDNGSWTFRHGGFADFDSNGDGILTAADDNVSIETRTYKGISKPSLVLDVVGAQIDAGLLAAEEVEGGSHTLAIWGVESLVAGDFVGNTQEDGSFASSPPASPPPATGSGGGTEDPDNAVPGATINGTNNKDTLSGTMGDDIVSGFGKADHIRGGEGDDVLNGGSGRYKADTNDHRDWIYGEQGNDQIDGGNGHDYLYGNLGNDYINGGLGGNDYIDGGYGNDRIVGGFRGPQDTPGDAVDQDILVGHVGIDVFEPRFWIKHTGWVGMDSNALGPNQDMVVDFEQGIDKLDATIYRQTSSGFEFNQGGFEAFDTNGDGYLDSLDEFVSVDLKTYQGQPEYSITLDVGAANLAAGRLAPSEVEDGPHTMTVFGITSLTQDDFVPTNLYMGLWGQYLSQVSGKATNDWIHAKEGNSVIDGRGGDDLLKGGEGNDVFRMTYSIEDGPGADAALDFVQGEDKLDGSYTVGSNYLRFEFSTLDTNANGVLDAGDEAVQIAARRVYEPGQGVTEELSTIIDLDVAYGQSTVWTGENSIATIGVTSLTAEDFVHPGDDLLIG